MLHVDADPALLQAFEEIRRREPIFHTPDFGSDFERMTAPGYWEVGASGRRYSRDFILRLLAEQPPVDAEASGWQTSDHEIRRLGPETYLFTYTLRQGPRVTRRSTIWERTSGGGWMILYHQGTIVAEIET